MRSPVQKRDLCVDSWFQHLVNMAARNGEHVYPNIWKQQHARDAAEITCHKWTFNACIENMKRWEEAEKPSYVPYREAIVGYNIIDYIITNLYYTIVIL